MDVILVASARCIEPCVRVVMYPENFMDTYFIRQNGI